MVSAGELAGGRGRAESTRGGGGGDNAMDIDLDTAIDMDGYGEKS
jgi:hypothetical protein